MNLYEYLRSLSEDAPEWLSEFHEGSTFSPKTFFASRVVFYPGSGRDGHAVKLFGSTHSAHCFLYADYGMGKADLEAELSGSDSGFRGYHSVMRRDLSEHDLLPDGWIPHARPERADGRTRDASARPSYGLLEILERDAELDDNHGASRLAILFLGADGIASYDALFCQDHSGLPPFAVVLQDHGFGGNYDRFGRGGVLEDIAQQCRALPHWLLVASDTGPWQEFEKVPDVMADCGGQHGMGRFLYRQCKG